jgi:hypothetical protein
VSERFGFWLAPVFFVDVPSDGAPSAGAPLFFILVMRRHEARRPHRGRSREGVGPQRLATAGFPGEGVNECELVLTSGGCTSVNGDR